MACSLDLLGGMYMPGSPGTVPRYMLPVMVGAGSGWRRGEVHGVEQGGSWCSHRGWSLLYGALEFVGLDVVEARHRPCVGAPFADPHGVCPRRRWVQAVRGDACDRAVVGGI